MGASVFGSGERQEELGLTFEEQTRLAECETVIEKGLKTFVEVGNALLEIRDSKLYRQEFGTFEEYCRERWRMSIAQGKRLIAAAEVVQNLAPIGAIPTHESQVRPLAGLEPEQQREAWRIASEATANPTAAFVEQVAATIERAITDAKRDMGQEINPVRVIDPEHPNPPFDGRWLELVGAIGRILRIEPFDTEAIVNQQIEMTDNMKRPAQSAQAARDRLDDYIGKLRERFPDVFA